MDYHFQCPHVVPSTGSPQFVGDPDLLFLREDIADELGAIIGYLECADQIKDYRINQQFGETANDEIGHFNSLINILAALDPVQAGELKKQGLTQLGVNEAAQSCGGINSQYYAGPERHRRDYAVRRPFTPDDRILECLRNAIRDEFHAINAYQKQILATQNSAVQNILTTIMNKEKEHASEFIRLFYDIYH